MSRLLSKNLILILLFCLTFISIGYLYLKASSLENANKIITKKTDCVPTFKDGGGPYYKDGAPFRKNIAPDGNKGEILRVRGKILENDCTTPVANATLDIWQANESGDYEDKWYRGKVRSDKYGQYSFETVIPKGYGEGTGYRPPHIHFKVFVNNQEIITSQMFLPEVKGTPGFQDAYIMSITRSSTDGKTIHNGYHDIILP